MLFPVRVAGHCSEWRGQCVRDGAERLSKFPVTTGAYSTSFGQVSATELSADGRRWYFSTMLACVNGDEGKSIALDSSGNVWLAGKTDTSTFPLRRPVDTTFFAGIPEGFVSEFNSTGTQLLFSTFLGGGTGPSAASEADGIAVEAGGNAYVLGMTAVSDFPV